ncbi:MAG: CRISPR-associated protein Csx19 [Chloroflexi bacterium]|nr:CRISPR-associated protein Csx19 [Chloroflexota bacterium]
MMAATEDSGSGVLMTVQSWHEPVETTTFSDPAALDEWLSARAAALGTDPCPLVAWCDHRVLIGLVTEAGVHTAEPLEPRFLTSLRLFNRTGELSLWREAGEQFLGRLRWDGQGDVLDVLEQRQSLWGTRIEPLMPGWLRVSEERGTQFAVPFAVREDDLPLCLRVRSYLKADEDGLVGVMDSRLCAFETWAGRPVKGSARS